MRALVAAAVAFALCAITGAMAFGYGVTTRPVLADNQLYFFQTERCASGVAPHVGHMEVKTQLPSLIGGFAIAVGRTLGADDVMSGRFSTVTAAAIAAILGWLLVFELTRSLRPPRGAGVRSLGLAALGASLVGAAAVFSIYGLYAEASSGFQPKVYMVAFLLGTHLACARRSYALTGFVGMCTFLCWQVSGLVLASCGLALLLDRRTSWASVFRVAAGALLAFGLYESYFWMKGALGPQLEQEWVLAFGAPHKDKPFYESVWFVLTEAQAFHRLPHGLPATFVAVAALMWLAFVVRPRRSLEILREQPGVVGFWIAAHLATAFTIYDHQAHPDMLLVQPYFAVGCGIGAGWLLVQLARVRFAPVLVAALTVALVGLGLRDAYRDVTKSLGGRYGLDQQRAMARIVSMYLDHRGSLYTLGSVHLLAFNRRDNWTPVGNVGHESSRIDMKSYRPLRDGRMPEVIVTGRGLRPGASGWLQQEYVDITPAPLAGARIRVYSRRSEDQPGFQRGTAPHATPGPKPVKK